MATYSLPVRNRIATKGEHDAAINNALAQVETAYEAADSVLSSQISSVSSSVTALSNRVDGISGGITVVGNWNASSGAFPTTRPDGSAIQDGDAFIVSSAGTVDGVTFAQGDQLIALVNSPGATYNNNWLRANYSALVAGLQKAPYLTVDALLASTEGPRGAGQIWQAEGFWYEEVLSNEDVSTAGGVKLRVIPADPDIVSVRQWGAKADGVTDDTLAIQAAMEYAHDNGLRICQLMGGTHIISMAASVNPYACLRVPANIHLRGQGMGMTTITRPTSERAVNGVLIVNRNWDTFGNYEADGNITMSGFYITDGAAIPTRPLGDLIALVHAENFHFYEIKAGNHDQHFFDICGVRNVLIERCFSENDPHPSGGTSVYQIDAPTGLGVWGAVVDTTGTENVTIQNCHAIHRGNSMTVQLNHSANAVYRNINILDNYFEEDGPYTNRSIIQCDNNAIEFYGLRIIGNTFKSQQRAINLFSNSFIAYENVLIADNIWAQGSVGRQAIWVGCNQTAVAPPRFRNVTIVNNSVNLDTTDITGLAGIIYCAGVVDLVVNDNNIKTYDSVAASKDLKGIWLSAGCERVNVSNNTIIADRPNHPTNFGSAIQIAGETTASGYGYSGVISDNTINLTTFGLGVNNNVERSEDNGLVISGNKFLGDFVAAGGFHLRDISAASDGTNGWRYIDMGGPNGELELTANQQTTVNYGLRIDHVDQADPCAGPKFHLEFAAGTNNFNVQVEELVPDVANNVGTYLNFINQYAGTVLVITGTGGVNMVLSSNDNQFDSRSSGRLRMWAGI